MKLIIFSGLVICTIAAPIEINSKNAEVIKDNLGQSTVPQPQHNLVKRQFNYAAPVFSFNVGKYNSQQQHQNAQFTFPEDRGSRNIKQNYLSGGHSVLQYQDHSIATTATPFESQSSRSVSQHKEYIPRYQQPIENGYRGQLEVQPDSVSSQPISYKPPVSHRQYITFNKLQQLGSQPVKAVSQISLQVVTPGPRSLFPNRPATNRAQHSDSGRQILDDTHFVLEGEYQPLNSYSGSLQPNFVRIQGEFSPHTQTSIQPNLFSSYENSLRNSHPPVDTANIFYATDNIPFRTGMPFNYGDRQIIPAPQELLNTALTIGNNIFERIPGYKLTSNLVGLLGNVTRLGVNFINTQFPLINPALLNPNQIDVYPNRPLIIPSNDYYQRPTPPTYTTTASPPQPILNSVEDTLAAGDTSSSNEHRGDSSNQADNDNDLRNSQENAYNSQQQEDDENPQTSQEHHYYSQENVHASQYSQEDQRQASPEKDTKGNKEVSQERVDYNMPAVADDVIPDDEFGIGDDDDKIDSKAIKSIVG